MKLINNPIIFMTTGIVSFIIGWTITKFLLKKLLIVNNAMVFVIILIVEYTSIGILLYIAFWNQNIQIRTISIFLAGLIAGFFSNKIKSKV